ncbi:hypothetical protein AB1Y20_014734 [Prymnesium parvum]|uniref:Uncharacterized protein n=1 Tax=Prymnesium parvum TaxID=97485 RepID=A0AB34IE02_PRYPA
MAPPVLFTADPAGRAPAPPGPAGVTVAWLATTLEKSLLISQDDRTASALYGMQMTDVGLCKIDNRLGSTAASLHLDATNTQGVEV